MPSILKKRNIFDSHHGGNSVQLHLVKFGRVSKSGVRLSQKKNPATVLPRGCSSAKLQDVLLSNDSKKRSLENQQQQRASNVTSTPVQRSSSRDQDHEVAKAPSAAMKTPKTPRKIAPLRASSKANLIESPLQGARAILEAFMIAPSAKRGKDNAASSISSVECSMPDFTTTSGASQPLYSSPPDLLSTELQDLVNLHSALLSALSLHYAHNGTSSPADLRALRPTIERLWGHRRVETEDIQRILGIQQYRTANPTIGDPSVPTLSMCEFGAGKICIEFEVGTHSISPSHHAEPLPTAFMRDLFSKNLKELRDSKVGVPLAPITTRLSRLFAASTARSKAAGNLSTIKAAALSAQGGSNASSMDLDIQQPPPANQAGSCSSAKPAHRSASLLDRIRAKETLAASQPAGPSSEALARSSALLRLEEAIPVIESLCTNKSRPRSTITGSNDNLDGMSLGLSLALEGGLKLSDTKSVVSFTMPALVEHLQNSLKQPIAREEAERCVRLLATEVLPQWVQLRNVGRTTGVTVRGNIARSAWVGRLGQLVEMERANRE